MSRFTDIISPSFVSSSLLTDRADAETAYFSITTHSTSNRSKEEPPVEGFFATPLEETVILRCDAPEPLQLFTLRGGRNSARKNFGALREEGSITLAHWM